MSRAIRADLPAARAALLLGGSSDIGAATLDALLPPSGSAVVLAGRASTRRDVVADRFATAHQVHAMDWDALDPPDPHRFVDEAASRCGRRLDLVLLAVGELGGGLADPTNADAASAVDRALAVDLVAPAGVLFAALRHLAVDGGRIVILTSASAVRPRAGIAAYSAAKQAIDHLARFASRDAARHGVRVHVVRPGHVRTTMTRGLPAPPLTRTVDQVARDIARGVAADRDVIWSPPVMRFAMAGLRAVPRWLLPAALA